MIFQLFGARYAWNVSRLRRQRVQLQAAQDALHAFLQVAVDLPTRRPDGTYHPITDGVLDRLWETARIADQALDISYGLEPETEE